MCTVTFFPTAAGVVITSNRDELAARQTAMPEWKPLANGRLFFPRDGLAGGTWVGVHEAGHVMVLLNGAFVRHRHQPPYRRSRGLIFLEIMGSNDPVAALSAIDLEGIEPFTVVLWLSPRLTEMRWDGQQRYVKALDPRQSAIWSSAMLYDLEVIAMREQWFSDWKKDHPAPTAAELRNFHTFTGDGIPDHNLLMNKDGLLRTVSITGIEWSPEGAVFDYADLVSGQESVTEIHFRSIAP